MGLWYLSCRRLGGPQSQSVLCSFCRSCTMFVCTLTFHDLSNHALWCVYTLFVYLLKQSFSWKLVSVGTFMVLSQSCLPFKSKGHPMKSLCRHRGGEGTAQTCLQSITSKVWVVGTMLRLRYPLERPGTHCTGGWVGLGAGMDTWKILLSLGFGPQTALPVTSDYTNCVIPATQPSL
jgi:hypothetical protein